MKVIDYSRPIAIWGGEDRVLGSVLTSTTAIIRSGGCSWNRCHMCQYRHERIPGVTTGKLIEYMTEQLAVFREQVVNQDPQLIKLYTSGSFFDDAEVPPPVRDEVAGIAAGRSLVVECRADYVSGEKISGFIRQMNQDTGDGKLIVAIGLETSSDRIREKSIDKGITFEQYVRRTEEIHQAGGLVKTYLLQKPPYLTERESLEDMLRSVHDITPYTDLISLNPCTVQRNTLVERLWKQGGYRPPYLWSVVRVMAESELHITCDPLGGGQSRGPHNCGSCDRLILDAIRDYNLNGDRELMRSVLDTDCSCKKEWECVLACEQSWAMPLTR